VLEGPAILFYQSGELNNDMTNWSGPNPAAVVAMLQAVAFRDLRPCRGGRLAKARSTT
jgi:hypothetical protein